MRMNELTDQERAFLDKVNKINLKICKDKEKSLWNVCNGYLHKKFSDDLLNKSDEEIKKVLLQLN